MNLRKAFIFILLLYVNTVQAQYFENEFSFAKYAPSSDHLVHKYEIIHLKSFKTTSGSTDSAVYIDFVGSGDIQKSLSSGNDLQANTGIGVIFERYNGENHTIQSFELESTINIATFSDSIRTEFNNFEYKNRREFGSYILNPVSGRQSLYLNSNIYFGYSDSSSSSAVSVISYLTKHIINGINVRLITSNNVWSSNDTTSNLGAIYFRTGVFHEFIPNNYRVVKSGDSNAGKSLYSIFLGVNYTYRGIVGDITAEQNEVFSKRILGSNQKSFHGCEINFGFKLNNLIAEFQMPVLKGQPRSIVGLTGRQFLFSIRFVGGFGLKLNKTSVPQA